MRKYNLILSVILIVVGFTGIAIAQSFVTTNGNANDPGAAFWPIMLCAGLVICAVGLIVQTLLTVPKQAEGEEPLIDYKSKGIHCVFLIFAIMIAYAVILYFCGFVIATLLFVVSTMLAMGERRILWLALATIGITGAIYVLFANVMGVILPQARIF